MNRLACFFAAALAAGCAHAIDPGVRATTPAPPTVAGATGGSETFAGAGGVQLYGRWWLPAGAPRAILVVQHGLNDHGDRYAHLAQTLVADGVGVFAMDLRGHGRSAGPRVEVDRFSDYVDDEATWIARVRTKFPGVPIFVFGHSMGGVIVTRYAEAHPHDVAGVVLSAPALGVDAPPLQVAGIQLVARLGAPGHMLPQRDADFSRDPAVVADMGRDPLLTHEDGPTHTAVALVEATRDAWADAGALTAPLLVLHGTADKLTSPAATRDFVARAGSADKQHVLIAGAWHDLTHDPATPEVEARIGAFIDAHAPGGTVAWQVGAAAPADAVHAPMRSAIGVTIAGQVDDERVFPPPGGGELGNVALGSAELGLRASLGPLWHGELDLRVRDGVGIDVLPIGVAVRLGRAGEIAIASGVRVGWPGTWSEPAIPVRISFEAPAGPLHLFGAATAVFDLRDTPGIPAVYGDEERGFDAMLAARLGGERDYWSQVSAGSGPFLGVTWHYGLPDLWGVVFGIHLWGAD